MKLSRERTPTWDAERGREEEVVALTVERKKAGKENQQSVGTAHFTESALLFLVRARPCPRYAEAVTRRPEPVRYSKWPFLLSFV